MILSQAWVNCDFLAFLGGGVYSRGAFILKSEILGGVYSRRGVYSRKYGIYCQLLKPPLRHYVKTRLLKWRTTNWYKAEDSQQIWKRFWQRLNSHLNHPWSQNAETKDVNAAIICCYPTTMSSKKSITNSLWSRRCSVEVVTLSTW